MQFDITGLLIFLAFILPGFVAQKARYSLVPRSLKPLSPVGEVGEFVLTGVWIHVVLAAGATIYLRSFAEEYFAALESTFHYGTLPQFIWVHRFFIFGYFILSLAVGYAFGFVQGVLIIRQPIRSWIVRKPFPNRVLKRLGVPGFLQEDPVWYFVLKQISPDTMVFLEVEMKNGAGIYTGTLKSYAILDDSVKSKDFYLEDVHFKENRSSSFVRLSCDGLLVNFEDALSVQVVKLEPQDALARQANEVPIQPKPGQDTEIPIGRV
jgi:hypothetical protein